MNLKPSNNLVKNSLNAHTWLGLTVGAVMYLICLSGAVVVFFEEFERWEQPNVEEYSQYSHQQITAAINEFTQRVDKIPESIYVVLPTEAVPRIHISADGKEWFVSQDGKLSEPVKEGWTHMLKELHVQLHLPQTFGIIVVGSLGAMLCGLIISGLLAHPRIFKDAFTFRIGGSKRLEQADIHNRLSVWGTPFYFMIGLTGAFIGLVGVLIAVVAPAHFNGDRNAVVDSVYGGDPIIERKAESINYQKAFDELTKINPDAMPIYLVAQHLNTEKQFLEIAATLPNRLIYSEMYRFHSDGSFINYQGLSDGPVGRQVAYSVYRLHFGHFDNGWVKILYAILGLALTVISATGINIWLARRKFESFINHVWSGFIWGTPLSLAMSYIIGIYGSHFVAVFWFCLAVCMGLSFWIRNISKTKFFLQASTSVALLICLLTYYLNFGS
ncbi:MAG: PepSY domain-containing protein, partial [Kangiellaceae bacterium]|nr:PepSY domain-containing protein [Kangiellaceae bacterium]